MAFDDERKRVNDNYNANIEALADTLNKGNQYTAEQIQNLVSALESKQKLDQSEKMANYLANLVDLSKKQEIRNAQYDQEQKALDEAIIKAAEAMNSGTEEQKKQAEQNKKMFERMQEDSKANKKLEDLIGDLPDLLNDQNRESNTNEKLKKAEDDIEAQIKKNLKGASLKDLKDPDSEYYKKQRELLEKQAEIYKERTGKDISPEELAARKAMLGALNKVTDALQSGVKELLNLSDKLGEYKQSWDTRLQGIDIGYDSLAKTISNSIGVSPFIKQSKVYEKLNTAIDEGIAFNVEQRAFLDVLSEGIATTFDAFDDTLKDLVRVQQADSTAYRLGMEASLTKYLNSMYESTEYLSSVSDTVTSNLYEASSLLSAENAIGTEYQIQKWLGSLYSVGMSNSSVGNISSALGKLLSGDVSVTESGAGKLLVMAASNSGIDLGSALTEGLDSSELNVLMNSVVAYLQSIASEGKNNNVVLNQMASLFDMNVSDLKAAQNLSGYNSSIYNTDSNYNASSALKSLQNSMNSYGSRMNMATLLGNLKDNTSYTLAGTISSSPVLYGLLYATNMLNEYAGGGNIPSISTLFGGIDLETNIADLMTYVTMGATLLGSMGGIINGLGQIGGGVGVAANAFGINTSNSDFANSIRTALAKKEANGYVAGDTSYVSYTYQGTSAGDDYTEANNATVSDAKTNAGSQVEDDDSKDMDDMYEQHNTIIEILNDLVDGNKSISVRNQTAVSGNVLWESMGV